jgi:hypothetical protein
MAERLNGHAPVALREMMMNDKLAGILDLTRCLKGDDLAEAAGMLLDLASPLNPYLADTFLAKLRNDDREAILLALGEIMTPARALRQENEELRDKIREAQNALG